MFCAQCGKELDNNYQFCIFCGAPTGAAGMSGAQPQLQQQYQQQYYQQYPQQEQQYTQPYQQQPEQYAQQYQQQYPQQQYAQQMQEMQQQQYAQQVQPDQQYPQQMPQMAQFTQIPQQQMYQMQPQQMMQQPAPNKKKRSKKPFVIAACALAVAAIGVGAFFFVRGKLSQKGGDSITVGGTSFSFKEGYSELANIPIAVQNDNMTNNGRKTVELGDANYLKATGTSSFANQEVSSSDYGIVGSVTNPDADHYRPGVISGTVPFIKNVSYQSNNLTSPYSVIRFMDYFEDDDNNRQKSYGYLKMSFVDGYKIDGLDKDSSEDKIVKAGYKPTGYQNVYYNIYSANGADWDKIDSDYDKIMKAKLSHAYVLKGDLHKYVSYDSELLGTFSIINDLISNNDKQRDYGFADQKEAYEDKDAEDYTSAYYLNTKKGNSVRYNTSYEETLKVHLAVAYQLHLMNEGKIDYFIIKEIDASNVEGDRYLKQGVQSFENRFIYPQNVLSIYVISSVEDYERFLKQAGWAE